MVERTTQGNSARTGAPRHRARKGLGAILSIALTTAATAAVAVGTPLVVTTTAASAATEGCTTSPVWGGINTLTGRDTAASVYAGGDLTITGPAAESEGLTVVGGNLDMSGVSLGFGFGNVAMGSGLWPYPDADVLAVGGTTTTPYGVTTSGGGRVGGSAISAPITSTNPSLQVEYDLGSSALAAVEPGDGGAPVDYTGFGTRVSDLSAEVGALPTTGTTTIGDAAPTDITVNQYRGNISTLHLENEAMVTFTGDGTSALQVFTLDGEALSAYAARKDGVSFDYENIPAGASVVVNVLGTAVTFAQGWQTIWNGVDIHDPFTDPTGFATASTAVLFNYGSADSVTITGGNATEIGLTDSAGNPLAPNGTVLNSSAAQSVGTIVSPHADMTIGATTNGRLFTGGDLTLDQASSAVIDLSLEHHSFPWIGSRVTSCLGAGSVSWTKTDAETGAAISGSAWHLTGPNALDLTVVDNGTNDTDGVAGVLSVTGLEAGDYSLIETVAPAGYTLDSASHTFSVSPEGMVVQLGTIANARIAGSVTWTKVDGVTSTALAGSSWRLAGPEGIDEAITDNGTLDTDTTEGVLAISGLPWGAYSLTETTAPVGYSLDSIPRSFEISADSTTVDLGTIANAQLAGTVTWTKVDGATSDRLSGSSWSLTGPDGSAETVIDNGTLDADDTEGLLTVTGLSWGDYTLTETTAPDGYALDPTPHTFSVTASTTSIDLGAIANARVPNALSSGLGGGVAAIDGGVLAHTGSTLGLFAGVAALASLALIGIGVTITLRRRRIADN